MKKRRFHPLALVGVLLATLVILIGVALRSDQSSGWVPLAGINDASPLGGKGFHMLLEREGLKVQREKSRLSSMPNAKLWILIDPRTRFSREESKRLLDWVKTGNTLLLATASPGDVSRVSVKAATSTGLEHLRKQLGIERDARQFFRAKAGLPLPPLNPLKPGAASIYRSGVSKASASGDSLRIEGGHLRIAGDVVGAQLARIDWGQGQVFVAPDALNWTNYALGSDDNAILAMNIVRAHARRGDLVVWDGRAHDEPGGEPITPSLAYFLWQPPLRYALLQVLGALFLVGLFWGRRMGGAVPLQSPPNALRASQWALAMSSLFQKVDRPHVAALTSGEHFRRALARRVGLSASESDELLAQRTVEVAGVDYATVDHLLMRSRTPSQNPHEMLRDVQAMEMLLQKMQARR